ncbi:hypothetical protein BPNPMPFG_001232 [Mesorhizobium sp. AR07]|uniref:hypothetical protein n=1 Tax=Mesorhizobium sp. AR07 TaxID=2865838 RepID=UPI00215EB799|nr:hypothetical protein [Mesorhizobium sp. AR07]UVK45675.1 hypothetical protein BPNPMPFG_001232 [Mesorhizobium sp. AR07]
MNPLLAQFEADFRDYIIEDLRKIGIRASQLVAPYPPEIEVYIRRRLNELRLAEHALQNNLLANTPSYLDHFKGAARIIAGVVSVLPPGRSERDRFNRVAELLNRGAIQGKESALDNHHVRRANTRYHADLLGVVNAAIRRQSVVDTNLLLRAELIGLTSTVRGLLFLWQEAKKHPRFSRLKGSELAARIDDFPTRFTRALELASRQVTA